MFTRLIVATGIISAIAAGAGKTTDPSPPVAVEQKPVAARQVSFQPAPVKVDVYDFVEAVLTVPKSAVANPFTDIAVSGTFQREGDKAVAVRGFCDAADGATFRIRFMPAKPGRYAYTISFRHPAFVLEFPGTFEAVDAKRRGILRVDKFCIGNDRLAPGWHD